VLLDVLSGVLSRGEQLEVGWVVVEGIFVDVVDVPAVGYVAVVVITPDVSMQGVPAAPARRDVVDTVSSLFAVGVPLVDDASIGDGDRGLIHADILSPQTRASICFQPKPSTQTR
jgi:hypothetical protein